MLRPRFHGPAQAGVPRRPPAFRSRPQNFQQGVLPSRRSLETFGSGGRGAVSCAVLTISILDTAPLGDTPRDQ